VDSAVPVAVARAASAVVGWVEAVVAGKINAVISITCFLCMGLFSLFLFS
jgi:hypothetical protein